MKATIGVSATLIPADGFYEWQKAGITKMLIESRLAMTLSRRPPEGARAIC
jgi:putative SOS response-associated peptidase YedK